MKRPELLDMQQSANFCYCDNKETFRKLAIKLNTPYLKIGKKHLYDKKDLLALMFEIKQNSTLLLSSEETTCQSTNEEPATGRNFAHRTATEYTNRPKLQLVERLKNTRQN